MSRLLLSNRLSQAGRSIRMLVNRLVCRSVGLSVDVQTIQTVCLTQGMELKLSGKIKETFWAVELEEEEEQTFRYIPLTSH